MSRQLFAPMCTQVRGQARAEAGEWEEALQAWSQALALHPPPLEQAVLHELRAQVLMEVGGKDWDAVKEAQRSVELAPHYAPGYLTLARSVWHDAARWVVMTMTTTHHNSSVSQWVQARGHASFQPASPHTNHSAPFTHAEVKQPAEPRCCHPCHLLLRAQLNFGEPHLALESYERLLAVQPENNEARAELDTCRMLALQSRQRPGQRAHVGASGSSGSAAGH